MALMSGKVYSNTGAPSNADGIDGDIYMQLDGYKTTYRKENGAWVAVGSTLGAIPEVISGSGAPSNGLGDDGQYYRDSASQGIYYKQGGVWASVGNLANNDVAAELDQAGIGKYLGTAPNVVTSGSMNDLLLAGEYYVTGTVTDMPTNVGSGYVKVWGLASNNVAQILQRTNGASLTEMHFRKSTGGVFGAWGGLANSGGDATLKFKALAGTASDDVVVVSQLVGVPSGGMLMWPQNSPPTGFIEANGQSTTPYPALAVIYGANVPDMRGEFVRGWDNGRGVDTARILGSNQPATRIQNIVGDTYLINITNGEEATTATVGASQAGNSVNVTGTTVSVKPRNVSWMFIIKT